MDAVLTFRADSARWFDPAERERRAARGRLFVELAYLAGAEADALWEPYDHRAARYADLPAETRVERERLERLRRTFGAVADRLGAVDWCLEASLQALEARYAGLSAAIVLRDDTAEGIAEALLAGAIVHAGPCTAGPHHLALFAVFRDPGGEIVELVGEDDITTAKERQEWRSFAAALLRSLTPIGGSQRLAGVTIRRLAADRWDIEGTALGHAEAVDDLWRREARRRAANVAAEALVGERGAGLDAARAGLERWAAERASTEVA